MKGGDPGRGSVAGKEIPNTLKVSAGSLPAAQDGSKSVMVIGQDGVAHKKAVDVGIQDAGEVQITGGISPSDNVITEGAYGLDDGTREKVAAAGAEVKPAGGRRGDDQGF